MVSYRGYNVSNYSVGHHGHHGHHHKTRTYHQGDSRLAVFHCFHPLVSANGEGLGYLAFEVPENVLLRGPKSGLLGTLVLTLVLGIGIVFLVIRTARIYVAPLHHLGTHITTLMDELRLTPVVGELLPSHSSTPPLYSLRELSSLFPSFQTLRFSLIDAQRVLTIRNTELKQANRSLAHHLKELQSAEHKLRYDALHDALTELANRTLF